LASARSALSHTMPGASELEILKQGLRCIIRDHEKRKGLTERPRTPATTCLKPADGGAGRRVEAAPRGAHAHG